MWYITIKVTTTYRCHGDLKMKFKGFTLAEVLITMGVIGIVAAMTLPGVLTNLERRKNAAILKRAYSDIQNYVLMFAYENECSTNLTDCTPNDGEFVWKFSEYLYKKQNFKDLNTRCNGAPNCATWFRHSPNRQTHGINIGQIFTITTPYKTYYLASPTGLYALYISWFMYDNYYNIKGDTFRARIHVVTDMNHKGYLKNGFGDDGEGNQKYAPQAGRNLFEVYIMNSKKVLPAGSPLCKGSVDSWTYYCTGNIENNCNYQTGNFTECTQKIIDDGWHIKYQY